MNSSVKWSPGTRRIGKRVVGEINVADHCCDMCLAGVPSQCRNRTTVGIDRHPGAFAEYMALTKRNLYAVPDSVSDDAAVFVEPLAAALQILEAVHDAWTNRRDEVRESASQLTRVMDRAELGIGGSEDDLQSR